MPEHSSRVSFGHTPVVECHRWFESLETCVQADGEGRGGGGVSVRKPNNLEWIDWL